MITTLNIDGINREFEQTEDGRLTTVAPKTGWERCELMERYYTIDGASQPETYHPEDGERYNRADYFNSPALAADIARATDLYRKLLRWQAEHDIPVSNGGYGIVLYLYHDTPTLEPYTLSATGKYPFDIIFSSTQAAQEAIKTFYGDLMWYFMKFRPRLDA